MVSSAPFAGSGGGRCCVLVAIGMSVCCDILLRRLTMLERVLWLARDGGRDNAKQTWLCFSVFLRDRIVRLGTIFDLTRSFLCSCSRFLLLLRLDLLLPHLTVQSLLCNQVGMRTYFNNTTSIHDDNVVAVDDGRQAMCDGQAGASLHEIVECRLQLTFRLAVER